MLFRLKLYWIRIPPVIVVASQPPLTLVITTIQPQLDHQERCPSSGRTALARRLLRGVTGRCGSQRGFS